MLTGWRYKQSVDPDVLPSQLRREAPTLVEINVEAMGYDAHFVLRRIGNWVIINIELHQAENVRRFFRKEESGRNTPLTII